MRRGPARLVLRLIVVAFALTLSFPFYWMALTSFKRTSDLYDLKNNPLLFNDPPTFEHWRFLFTETLYPHWLANTMLVGLAVVAITLLLAVPAAYGLARRTGRWGERAGIVMFLMYLVPPTLLFIPMSRIVAILHLQDSLWSLILIYPTFTVPFATWLLMGFFKSIPRDLEDAAMVDGLSRFSAFLRVIVPVSFSGLVTVSIFAFTLVLQEFVYALTFLSSVSKQTVGVGVPIFLIRGDVFYWGELMAACLVACIPVAIVYNIFLDRLIQGFTVGAVK